MWPDKRMVDLDISSVDSLLVLSRFEDISVEVVGYAEE